MVGLVSFLLGPTKMFFLQNGEKTRWECIFSWLTKIPMCNYTWASSGCLFLIFFYFLFYSLGVIVVVVVFFFFFWIWFFINKIGWLLFLFFLVLCHFFCFNWASFFNKGIWVNLFKLIFSIFLLFHSQPIK